MIYFLVNMELMVINNKSLIIVLILIVVLAVGFLLGMVAYGYRQSSLVVATTNLDAFTSATALIEGMVTGVDKNIATVKNQNGSVGKYVVAEGAGVFTLKPGAKQSTASAGLNEGLLNKKSVIQLNYQSGRFEIVSISLVPETPGISASPAPKK